MAVFNDAREGDGDGVEFFPGGKEGAEVFLKIVNKLFRILGGRKFVFSQHFTPPIKESEESLGATNIDA